MYLAIEQAEQAIAAARKKAREIGTQMCIAVVDSGESSKKSRGSSIAACP